MSYTIVNKMIPSSLYSLKAPYPMDAQYITIHNTANDATALNEIAYMTRNPAATSYHVAIDDKHAVEAIPFSRNAWHAGDGNGKGNRQSIGIEICYSKSGGVKYQGAEQNAIEYIAHVLHQFNWDVSRVLYHKDWSGKNCPHRIFSAGRADAVKREIGEKLAELKNPKKEVTPVAVKKKTYRKVLPTHEQAWKWAKKEGYLNGEQPGEFLTREQFATVLQRIYGEKKK